MERETCRTIHIQQEGFSWAKTLSKDLETSESEIQKIINRNNTLPLEEREGKTVIFTRFHANASLLAQASLKFRGPRGPRPYLVSQTNVLDISNLTSNQMVEYRLRLKQVDGDINDVLRQLKLTASNISNAPEGVKFSHEDARNGIYIPKKIDIQTAQALGITFGNGMIEFKHGLVLTSKLINKEFYEHCVRNVFQNAFNFSSDQKIRPVPMKGAYSKKEYIVLFLEYGSEALKTYLKNHLGFPQNRDERKKTGLPEEIKNMDDALQDEFLKYFLASAMAFRQKRGIITIHDVSKPLLEDVETMIKMRIKKHSPGILPDEGAYSLCINMIPTRELYALGFLNENPRIKKDAENYFSKHPGKYLPTNGTIAEFPTRQNN